MYNENNNGINLKDIIIKAIFLVLFVLLIVWLFPKVPNMKAFYSNVFRENIKYMQEAAESYYTTDKLPKNDGESVELTLQEMIDKNIIIPFVDKDGKECDGKKSFAQITKNKTDYTLTVTLVCPKEKNTLKKTLGCHNYCADCESLENQFQRQVTSNQNSVNCNRGGSFNGSKCVIATPVPVVYDATKITTPGTSVCSEGTPDGKGGCLVTTMVNENGKVEYTNGGTTTVPAERVETTTYVAANSSQTKSYVPASKSTQTTYVPAREVGGTETVVKALVRQGNDVTYPA